MKKQTSHTPKSTQQITPERTALGIKPPIFPQEMLDKFEQLMATPFSEKAVKEFNDAEARIRQEKLKQKQQSEFIEINGIRLETENLGSPTHPQIKILKKGDKIIIGKPYCWNDGDDWYYNWYAAIIESDYLGKRIPTDEESHELFGSEEGFKELTEKLNLKPAGRWDNGIFNYRGSNAYFWSSTIHNNTNAYSRNLNWNIIGFHDNYHNKSTNGFSVRCIINKPKEKPKSETEEERKRREFRELVGMG